ncbi:MAG: ATP-binding protein [candidate division KSB1 bacterium]|nr:ATP-binding protein [candidate division KSB1 bacterium]
MRTDFLREVLKLLLDFSGADAVLLHLKENSKYFLGKCTRPESTFSIEIAPCANAEIIPASANDSGMQRLRREVAAGQFDPASPFFTSKGSFWTGDAASALHTDNDSHHRSLALIPLITNDGKNERIGLLELRSAHQNFFSKREIEFYEGIAQILSVALAHRRAQVNLRERVKELTCLYEIAQVVERPGVEMEEMLQSIVELLPPAWLYPEIACARIIVDGRAYYTTGFEEVWHKQTADIIVNGERRGEVAVVYVEHKPEQDEGPFLKEERNLIEAVARELALLIERKKAEDDKVRLQEQLRHADRLATIGQLSAGVAHELNEPLGSILGFAQLAKKCPDLPKQAEQDIEKIVHASLYAREIIRKLMLFARQMPQQRSRVNLNQLVIEALSFFESRFAKEGITLVRALAPDLPVITADPSQLTQVLVNLVVNAIQAMPQGGTLTVGTCFDEVHVILFVADTGIGMSEEIRKQIFVPFFTTKEVGQGTGLGLSVVHGIVTAHGGTITVESEVGRGSRFEIRLPVTLSSGAK